MNYRWLSILLASICLLSATFDTVGKRKQADNISINAEVTVEPKGTVYVGQAVEYTVSLFSNIRDIRNIVAATDVSLKNCKIIGNEASGGYRISKEMKDGKAVYRIDVSHSTLVADAPGTAKIKGKTYALYVDDPDAAPVDPFFGMFSRPEMIKVTVQVPDIQFKAKALPKAPVGFSGAIGDFKIIAEVPEYIEKDDDAVMSIVIEGQGVLGNSELDLKSLFTGALRMKSAQPIEQRFYKNGQLYSKTTYQCVFKAVEYGSFTLPALSFTFFNPADGKYVTVNTEPKIIKVSEEPTRTSTPSSGGVYVMNFPIGDMCIEPFNFD